MNRKNELKKQIEELQRKMDDLEIKRSRSEAKLLNAMISDEEPDPTDTEFFRVITAIINEHRETMRKLLAELETL